MNKEKPIPKDCPFCGVTPEIIGSGSGFYWVNHPWIPKCPTRQVFGTDYSGGE